MPFPYVCCATSSPSLWRPPPSPRISSEPSPRSWTATPWSLPPATPRFGCVFTASIPRRNQDGGREARAFTSDLALFQSVTVLERDIDRYGRVVGDVRLTDGRVLNREIIRTGHGWWYQRYAPLSTDLQKLEAEARLYRRGIWSGWTSPEAPWQWRKQVKEATHSRTRYRRRSEPRSLRRSPPRSERRSLR
ncbi:MAG: thermonuclease family protein [Bryobacteraceae bacterium]|nr:thermonuclease family protein [Bryobacteraceae bacterium]